jgi:eukaryotic-like serine/threonine-protein kinase
MKLLVPGSRVDQFVVGDCIHAGGMAHIYSVTLADSALAPGFAMVMKIPRMGTGDGAENIVSFEVEQMILPALTGTCVPQFVAAGDLAVLPYLVMEHVQAPTLQSLLEIQPRLDIADAVRYAAAVASAAHHLHSQNAVHLDIKPSNVLIRPEGGAVLIDFGLSYHAHFPDLLAEEMRKAVGSNIYMAPEQVVGVRGDPRSDVYAIGTLLYYMVTGEYPFGEPETTAGLRQRLWMEPRPPRSLRSDMPAWLQEIILRCLEPKAELRFPTAAHLAFDLTHSDQVLVTERGQRLQGAGLVAQFKRWVHAAGLHYQASPLPSEHVARMPIVMVALPHRDVSEATLVALRHATGRALGNYKDVGELTRLACVSVISPNDTSSTEEAHSETNVHLRHLTRMRAWAAPLKLDDKSVSYHVLESTDVATALISYAHANHVGILVLGAATHGLQFQSVVPTVPIKVAMHAACSVILVKTPETA